MHQPKDTVGLYLERIARYPLLSAEDEVDLARQIELGLYADYLLDQGTIPRHMTLTKLRQLRQQGQQAKQRFIAANLRLVVSIARKYNRDSLPLLDLIQEGNVGLIRAVEKFDYTKGFKFSTCTTWWIRQAIFRGIAAQGHIVKLPVHIAEQISKLSTTTKRLTLQLGRTPQPAEIAAELDLTDTDVNELMAFARSHASLDAPVGDDLTTLGDLIAHRDVTMPDEVVIDTETTDALHQLLEHLDDRSADVIRRRFGLADGRPAKLVDIGEAWGISAERVRQIEQSAMNRLRTLSANTDAAPKLVPVSGRSSQLGKPHGPELRESGHPRQTADVL